MTRKEICDSMTLQDAIQVFRDTNAYGTMDLAKTVILEALEQKTGHWIWCAGSHKCSNCEEYTCFSDKKLLRYCPYCGCQMEGENKNEY